MSQPELKEVKESVYEILDLIRKDPRLYIGEPQLVRVALFITGYQWGLGRNGLMFRHDEPDFRRRFHEWIAQRLGFAHSGSGWQNMIRERCASEREAFDRFYELLDEFKTTVA